MRRKNYYRARLSAHQLKQVYEIAPMRIRQYLEAEEDHVLKKIKPGDTILELGCGYGRIIPKLAKKARRVFGIDTSFASLCLGKQMLQRLGNCHLLQMNAVKLAFRDKTFDRVICLQNGISALHVNQKQLIKESIRITKQGGNIFFSSYADKFWHERLDWFQRQSDAGLVGEIDYAKTHDGVIVCKDGFTATTVRPEQFRALTAGFDVMVRIIEVDGSSLLCEIVRN